MWDLIILIPDHCLSFYFANLFSKLSESTFYKEVSKFQ